MKLWRSVVGKLWMTIIGLVAVVLLILGMFSLQYIDMTFTNSFQVKKLFIITCMIGFAMTTTFAFFLSTKITQPLMQLKRAARLIAQGDYQTRVESRSSDEIGELAQSFNQMAEELDGTIRVMNREKEQLSSILRSMTDAVITMDAEGRVLLANPKGQAMIRGWSELSWPDGAPVASSAEVPEPLFVLFASVLEQECEVTSKLHVQSEVWSVVMTPLSEGGTIRGAVAVLRDVTEEHRLDKLRKDFLANVSHELRTPLSMVQGYSEALLDDIAGNAEERKELAQVIHDESLRMGRLVQDLLDLAKLEAGRMDFAKRETDLGALLSRVHRKFAALSKDRGIQLSLERDAEMVLTEADEDRLEQVLTNLLDNALRHTPSGASIRLTGSRSSDGKFSILKVQDEGQGIAPDDLPYIFERFYKADKARTRGAQSGTGLGLAIVRSIVEAHRGTVTAESDIGQGTTFTVTLPLYKP